MESIKEFRGNELAQASAVKEDLTCSSSSPLNKSDQAISDSTATANDSVRPDRGPKRQATSVKPQAASDKPQASSYKQQASSVRYSCKQQALNVVPIVKRQAWRFAMIGQQTVDRG